MEVEGALTRMASGPTSDAVVDRLQHGIAVGLASMTAVSEVGRGQPSLADRVVARALALSVDPAASSDATAEILISLARGNRELLERALRRVRARGVDRPSRLTAPAVELLQVALERLSDTVVGVTPERRTP